MPWLRVQFMISLQMFQANVRQECMDAEVTAQSPISHICLKQSRQSSAD